MVAGLAIYVVVPSLARVIGAWPQLSTLTPAWLAGALVAEIASFLCTFALQRLVLQTEDRFAVTTAGLAGNAVTNVLPAGDAAGAALQFRMLATAGIDSDTAAGGLAASSLLGIGGLLALPIFTLPAVLGSAHVKPGLVHAALLGMAGFVLFVIGGIAVMTTDQPLALVGRVAQWVWNSVARHHPPMVGLDRRLLHERDEIRSTLGKHGVRAVLLIAGRLGFDYLCLLATLRATSSDPQPSLVLLAYSAAVIVALLPITPGGIGIVEASLSGMLILVGVRPASALLATLVYRMASYWLPLLAGPVAYFLFRRRYGVIKEAPKTPGPSAKTG